MSGLSRTAQAAGDEAPSEPTYRIGMRLYDHALAAAVSAAVCIVLTLFALLMAGVFQLPGISDRIIGTGALILFVVLWRVVLAESRGTT